MQKITSERGIAAIIALIMVGMLTLIGLASISTSDDEMTIASNSLEVTRSFYAAESGLEMVAARFQQAIDSTGGYPTSLPTGSITLNSSLVTYSATDNGAAVNTMLTSGSLAGLYGSVKTYTVASTALTSIDNSSTTLSQDFSISLVPIFQFAVFYDHDLYMTPLYNMTIDGRVHINGDMRMQTYATLRFTDDVTSAGRILHGFPAGMHSSASGNIYFKDNSGLYRAMYQGGSWLDHNNANWYSGAAARWDGRVQDVAFGQEVLSLPLSNTAGDPHKIIEPSTGNPDSYESKSEFKIIDGTAFAKIGSIWQDVTASLPSGTIVSNSFYDGRERTTVSATTIDMDKLATSGYFPGNGVLYASDTRSGYRGLRLTNGSDISYPLSVFSHNPVYVQGDYNTVDKQPAAIVADAVTFLSNAWTDSKSTWSMTHRNASTTSANVALITGDTEAQPTNYGGGLENLPRFLEDWGSTTFRYRGSLIALWRAQQSTGEWRYSWPDPYYTAPTRDWGFDPDFADPANLPPSTPSVISFERNGWRQHDVGFSVQ